VVVQSFGIGSTKKNVKVMVPMFKYNSKGMVLASKSEEKTSLPTKKVLLKECVNAFKDHLSCEKRKNKHIVVHVLRCEFDPELVGIVLTPKYHKYDYKVAVGGTPI
jgi:hypothetical protein